MTIFEQIIQYFGYTLVGVCAVVILFEFIKVFIKGNNKKDPKSLRGH